MAKIRASMSGGSGGGNIEDMLLNGQYATAQNSGGWNPITINIPSGATYAMFTCNMTQRGSGGTVDQSFTNATVLATYYDTYSTASSGASSKLVCCLRLTAGESSFICSLNTHSKTADVVFL